MELQPFHRGKERGDAEGQEERQRELVGVFSYPA